MNKNKEFFLLIVVGLLMTVSAVLFADDTGFTTFNDTSAVSPLTWSGTGSVHTRYMTDYDDIAASTVILYPELHIGLHYKGESSGFTGSFTLSGNHDFTNSSDIAEYLSSMIDEAYYRTFFSGFNLSAGFMKIVWGKGDEIFTFDNINAVDYSDFMNNSYLDRKKAEAMIKLDVPFGQQGLIEALYTPVFTPDTFPTTGPWVQSDYTAMTAMGITTNKMDTEDMKTLSHGQGGIHITNSLGGVDFGAAYEYTFLREPVVNMSAFMTDPTKKIKVTWDRLHLFGIEAAAALGGFNFRGEGAYYLTGDTAGTDPLVHNNKIQYLAGFDKNIPVHNMSINIQDRGEIILGSDGIKDNEAADIEYSDSGSYISNIIAADLRDTFFNDTLTVKMSGAYSAGSKSYMLAPGIEYTIKDDAAVKIRYTLYRGDSGTLFGQFKNNDMLEVIFQYSF